MTLGEKLRIERQRAGLSQAELGRQIHVSRQAITKWEADRGIPDIENLIALSKAFGVSIDELLDEQTVELQTRTELDIADYKEYERGNRLSRTGARSKFDAAAHELFGANFEVIPLVRLKHLTRWESIIDFIVKPGVLQVADSLRDTNSYYLLEHRDHSRLARITPTEATTQPLAARFTGKKMVIGGNWFKKAGYRLGSPTA